jgi:hypothetical protein
MAARWSASIRAVGPEATLIVIDRQSADKPVAILRVVRLGTPKTCEFRHEFPAKSLGRRRRIV